MLQEYSVVWHKSARVAANILTVGRSNSIEKKGSYFTKDTVPISEKVNLTLEEAAAYFNIGMGKIRELSNTENCPFVLWVGSKRMIKRKKMEAFLDGAYSI